MDDGCGRVFTAVSERACGESAAVLLLQQCVILCFYYEIVQ